MRKQIIRLVVAAMTFAIGIALATPALLSYRLAVVDNSVSQTSIGSQFTSTQATDTSSIEETIGKLRQFRLPDVDISPAVRPLLTRLKHQLRDFISATINAPENQGKSAELLQAGILINLRNKDVTVKAPTSEDASAGDLENYYVYGNIYGIRIQQPPSHPELLAAITTISVWCGDDSSLYLFKRVGARWELVLAQEANDYKDVSGAQGMFDYAISPPDAENNFFVMTSNVNPWCVSNWQTIRYSLLRVGPGAYQPPIMASGEETIYLGVDVPYKLAVGRHWASINFYGDASKKEIMNGETTKKHVVKYIVNEEKARKISE
jgi:hypothetical protein